MSAIEKLKAQIDQLTATHKHEIKSLNAQLQTELNRVFDDDARLQQAIAAVESSNEFGCDEIGVYSWVRFDLARYKQDKAQLENYLGERFIEADFENDALKYSQGASLIINDDGDVYDEDSGEFIIDAAEYTDCVTENHTFLNHTKRNKLIENWMESNGYYPGVFSVDRYGKVTAVNTQKIRG